MNLIRKEKDGGYLSFLISIPLGAQDQLPNLQEPVKNKSVGHKTNVGSLVQETVVILRQGEQRWTGRGFKGWHFSQWSSHFIIMCLSDRPGKGWNRTAESILQSDQQIVP